MTTIRAAIMSLVAGIAIGFVIYPELLYPDPIHPDPREQAANAYLCGVIGDEERVQREILHDGDAVRSPECDPSQWGAQAGPVGRTESVIERLLAWLSGRSKVASSDQPKSIASTP